MKISELKAKAGLSPDTRVYDAQKAKKRQETSNQAGGKTVAFTPKQTDPYPSHPNLKFQFMELL